MAGAQFDVVHDGADWHEAQWQGVADFDVGLRAAVHTHAYFETLRRKDVAFRAVFVMQQRDAAGAVWIVFNCGNLGFVCVCVALEVDNAILLFVPAALVTRGDATVRIATASRSFLGEQRALWRRLGDIGEV